VPGFRAASYVTSDLTGWSAAARRPYLPACLSRRGDAARRRGGPHRGCAAPSGATGAHAAAARQARTRMPAGPAPRRAQDTPPGTCRASSDTVLASPRGPSLAAAPASPASTGRRRPRPDRPRASDAGRPGEPSAWAGSACGKCSCCGSPKPATQASSASRSSPPSIPAPPGHRPEAAPGGPSARHRSPGSPPGDQGHPPAAVPEAPARRQMIRSRGRKRLLVTGRLLSLERGGPALADRADPLTDVLGRHGQRLRERIPLQGRLQAERKLVHAGLG
jgi:hypothetical protein